MKNEVPFLDLKKLHEPYTETFAEIAKETVTNAAFVGGPAVAKFEEDFAKYCDAPHCVGVANGTESMIIALDALGVGPGDEVITAANTFIATVEAIGHSGATPVFVDCESDTWLIDPKAVEAAITPKTAAIIPVHLYGQPAEMDEINRIAEKHGLAVIEDSAQAHGARYKGKRVGTLGNVASFSFYPGKNLGACGDGGAVTTRSEDLADTIRTLSQHGQSKKYYHRLLGYNSRLDALQARFLREKLVNLDRDNSNRRKAAAYYDKNLGGYGERLVTPVEKPEVEGVYHLYVVHVADRLAMLDNLKKHGVNCAFHYPVPCHLQEACADLGYSQGEFPNAEFNARHCLSLPMFPDITEEQLERVTSAVAAEIGTDSLPSTLAA
ncbi:MAG: DegT/DnrJ/EryC1/StrS family aminotransferase [Verrucomicrobiota bacterium]